MAATFNGVPRAVVRLSLDTGAHPDCLIGSVSAACQDCRIIINDSIDQVYGHLGNSRAIFDAIVSDILQEEMGG